MMLPDEALFLFGASVRAAAFSALRAGLFPCCYDLFADADLQQNCVVERLPRSRYPHGFIDILRPMPRGQWMYTGALENHPTLLSKLARFRPLWGNRGPVVAKVRNPQAVFTWLSGNGIPCPQVRRWGERSRLARRVRWLVKPLAGAGGRGIAFWDPQSPRVSRAGSFYFQEYIEGESLAAVYVGDGRWAELLGVTRQLIGETWLHAAPFHYCGSVGPVALSPRLRDGFAKLGQALVEGFHLRGLFGVDCVVCDETPWPVEINPRYTASVEVLEHATGVPALALHRRVFDPVAPPPEYRPALDGEVIGKAVLFARAPLIFPDEGPWQASLTEVADAWALPEFADIPTAGERIAAGRPVLTIFSHAPSEAESRERLRQIAARAGAAVWEERG
jgi:predicted ATP-grasp superfamily ATP-dependent carboligase